MASPQGPAWQRQAADGTERPHIPWNALSRSLQSWLASLRDACKSKKPHQVFKLMEGLVSFMASNHGTFLATLMTSDNVDEELKRQGAPDAFIKTFRDVLNIVALTSAPSSQRIITFGTHSRFRDELARLLRCFADSAAAPRSPSPSGSPRGHLTGSPRAAARLLDDHAAADSASDAAVAQAAPPAALPAELEQQLRELSIASMGAQDVEPVRSVRLSRLRNVVAVSPGALPPELVTSLAEERAVPFLYFRRLSACFVEVLFCVMWGGTTYVVDRKVIYVGPRSDRQLEGRLALPAAPHKALLMGTEPLQWHDAARLLEAPPHEGGGGGGAGGCGAGDHGDGNDGEVAGSEDVPASA